MARSLRRSGRRTSLISRSRAKSPQEKAIYHNVVGAGRAKVKREFFDIGPQDLAEIAAFLETRMGDNLTRGESR